jgi:transcriptional regulator with XRE-family HTH domain
MDAQRRIKQLMEERDWTDYQLAKESNLSHSTVTNMFNRNNAPTLPTLEAVCKAFGITLAQFFTEGNSPELTEEQRILFAKWSTLKDDQKQALLALIDTMRS